MQGISHRYKIIATLPGGGMADVYLAEDTHLYNEQVVIKQFKSSLDDSLNRLRKLFEREIQVLRNLDHPHIIKIRDWGSSAEGYGSRPYYVMSYMAGGSLQQKIVKQKKFSLAETIHILQPLAQALDYAHSKGVRHFDIKPANILFDKQDQLYLSDFGLALDSDVTVVQIDGVGTASYMSPEQLNIDRVDLDHRADLYALGVIIFQMLTGTLPYTGALEEIIVKHLMDPVPDIYFHRHDLPLGLQPIFDKAMAKDRTLRFDSAGELLSALQQVLKVGNKSASSKPVRPASELEQMTGWFPPPKRHPYPVEPVADPTAQRISFQPLTALIIVVVLCGGVLGSILQVLAVSNIVDSERTLTPEAPTIESTVPTRLSVPSFTVAPTVSTSTPIPSPTERMEPTSTATALPSPTVRLTAILTSTLTPITVFRATTVPAILLNNLNDCNEGSIATFAGLTTIQFEWRWSGFVDTSRGNYLEIRVGPRTGTLVSRGRIENEAYFANNNLWIFKLAADSFFDSNYYDYEWQIFYMSQQGQSLRASPRGCFRIIP